MNTITNISSWKQQFKIESQAFPNESTVWIYQSNKAITAQQQAHIQVEIGVFTANWVSHKQPVKAWGTILFNHFIILMADETLVQVSGCSKDSMMHCIQSIQKQYSIDLLNRTQLAFIKNNVVEIVPIDALAQKIAATEIDEHTL